VKTKFSGLSSLWTFVLVLMGYGVLVLTGCGGDGGSSSNNNNNGGPPPPQPDVATVAGTLSVGEGQVLDGDTSDPNDPVIDNNTDSGGQVVSIPVNIGGYANIANDEFDVYRVTLPGPITIVLGVAEPEEGDLDLLFVDLDGMVLQQSIGTGFLEVIETDPDEGEFFVVVQAFAGASNYVLSLGLTTDTATTLSALTHDEHFLSTEMDFVADEIIVKLKDGADTVHPQSRQASLFTSLGLVQKAVSPSGPRLMAISNEASPFMLQRQDRHASLPLRYPSAAEAAKVRTLEIIKKLRRDADVEYAEPNYISHTTVQPNDDLFNLQWHYPLINLPQAWDITMGDDDIVVAVIDTGVVTTHPDLANRMLRDTNGTIIGFDFIRDAQNARDGDGIDSNPFDVGDLGRGTRSSFHGTHVAGTIAADTNNRLGVAGVTWNGTIMPLRVLGAAGGTEFDLAQAILYATGAQNVSGTVPPVTADVINMSLGPANPNCQPLPRLSRTLSQALTTARNAGVVVVVAAGNDDCDVPAPLSTFAGVISVSAVDLSGKAPYSNFGSTVDVAAPGGNIGADRDGNGVPDGVLSTLADDSGGELRATVDIYQGTSMAAPHMAGVVALMLAVNPALTPDDINMLLADTHPDPNAAAITRDLGASGRDDVFGHGLIDAFQAVNVARNVAGGGGGTPPADTPVLVVSPESLNFGATTTSLPLSISNRSTAELMVSSITADAPWITIDSTDLPTLTVTVNRSDLPNGTSLGRISIESNGGNETVPVSVEVQASVTGGDVGTVYVLMVDPDTLDTVAQAMTSATQSYTFQTPTLAPGRYLVVSGTDRNNDGFICDNGEACGVFPLIDSPRVIEVEEDRTDIEFPVSFAFSVSSETNMLRAQAQRVAGFKRLDAGGSTP
jgi:serine protease